MESHVTREAPAITTLGMGAAEVTEVADIITSVLSEVQPATDSKAKYSLDDAVIERARGRVTDLLARHPLYPEINLDIINV